MMFSVQFFKRCPFPHFIDITGETRSRRYRGSWAHLREEARLSLGLGGKGQVEIRRRGVVLSSGLDRLPVKGAVIDEQGVT